MAKSPNPVPGPGPVVSAFLVFFEGFDLDRKMRESRGKLLHQLSVHRTTRLLLSYYSASDGKKM